MYRALHIAISRRRQYTEYVRRNYIKWIDVKEEKVKTAMIGDVTDILMQFFHLSNSMLIVNGWCVCVSAREWVLRECNAQRQTRVNAIRDSSKGKQK